MKANALGVLMAVAGLGAAAFFLLRPRAMADGSADYVPDDTPGFFENLVNWTFPDVYKSPAQWREELQPLFRRTETTYAMPDGLLEAVAERESAFRHDIITCETLGKVGEEGIMQLRPEYHMANRAERCNPYKAIPYAGNFLAKQYLRFLSWDEAIAAYNWGPTNVANFGVQLAPAKTKEYVAFVTTTAGIRG